MADVERPDHLFESAGARKGVIVGLSRVFLYEYY